VSLLNCADSQFPEGKGIPDSSAQQVLNLNQFLKENGVIYDLKGILGAKADCRL